MDAIVAHTQRSRESARVGAEANGNSGTTALNPGTDLTVDNFSIDNINPSQLQAPPQTEFDVKVTWSSDGGFGDIYDTNHPDFCTVGFINRPGAQLYVRLKSGGGVETTTQPACWSTANESPVVETMKAVSINSEGNQTLTAELVGAVTGEVHDTATVNIDVTSGVDKPPDFEDPPEDDDPNNDNGDGDGPFPWLPDGQLIGTTEAIGIGAGLALLLVVLIATR
jgi:hypothetical protein